MSKTPRFPPRSRTVLFVLFPGFQILDIAGPLAAFEIAARFAPNAYRLKLAAAAPGMTASSAGVAMPTEPLKGQTNIDTIVVSGGNGTGAALGDIGLIT